MHNDLINHNGTTPCQRGPLTTAQKYCDRIAASSKHNSNIGFPCNGEVCIHCITAAANRCTADEQWTIQSARRAQLCRRCQLHEAKRHPNGYSSCTCQSMFHNRWMCFPCRHSARVQLEGKKVNKEHMISYFHRDRRGRNVLDWDRRRRSKLPCPSCARWFINWSPRPNYVTYCMACNGIIVEPTQGSNYLPTNLMLILPTRRSERLAARYTAVPPLDFAPDIILAD